MSFSMSGVSSKMAAKEPSVAKGMGAHAPAVLSSQNVKKVDSSDRPHFYPGMIDAAHAKHTSDPAIRDYRDWL